jgi:REP element-mobilizing transposase RayT
MTTNAGRVGAGFKPAPTTTTKRARRRSIRLRGYDYARGGAYFITVCTKGRKLLFGDVVNGAMHLNDAGQVVQSVWDALPMHYPNVTLDAFVVMPNHIHGIIVLTSMRDVGAGFKPAPTGKHGLPEIARALKTFSSRRFNEMRGTPGVPIWQRGYHDRIIRNDGELRRIRRYIVNNPKRWLSDPENPVRAGLKPAPKDGPEDE